MASEVVPYVINENPTGFNLTHINCGAAHSLFDQVKVVRDIGQTQLLVELNSDFTPDTSKYVWRKSAIMQLVKLAFTTSKVGEAIIGAMEKYDYPKGRSYKSILDSMLYTLEEELPLCDFNTKAPTNRERYVACCQMINYFCLLKASSIFKQCAWDFLNSNDDPRPLQSLGSFIFYSEDPSKQTHANAIDSWSFRRKWEEELKESYCQRKSKQEAMWQSSLCIKDKENLPDLEEQNLGYWKDYILPLIKKNGAVYSSTVQSQINTELLQHAAAKNHFKAKAFSMDPFFTNWFAELEKSFKSSKESEETIRKVIQLKEKLDMLTLKFLNKRSIENWNELQDHVQVFEIFIKAKPLGQEYTHIEALLQGAKQLWKPTSQVKKDEF